MRVNNFKLLFIAFCISQEIFPQIPINGFCRYNRFPVDKGCTELLTLNFNNDSYTDLILFNPGKKKIIPLEGGKDGELISKRTLSIPVEISSIKSIVGKRGNISGYAFISRNKMKAGIYNFQNKGRSSLSGSIEFDSYPENLSIADVDLDNKSELLISGSAFNGLSLIAQEKSKLKEKKIISKTAFSNAVLASLNNDEFPDIAAFEIISRSFIFFYNNGKGEFQKARTIPFHTRISSLHSYDLNLDSYEDLIFTSGNSIIIMYGDFRSAYDKIENITTQLLPDKFITGDFNKDGLIDIVYLDLKESVISVLFAKDEFNFYPELIYLQKKGLKSIAPFYSKFIDGIIALSDEGNIYTITKLRSISDEISMAVGGNPSAISFFDRENNGITDICFIDNYDKKFKFILRNNAGIPGTFYSFPLFEPHSQILVDNSKPDVKNYFCYSSNKRLIEIIKVDFSSNKIQRNTLYSPGPIRDLKVKIRDMNRFEIYIAYLKGSELNLGIYNSINSKYSFSSYPVTTSNIYEANISISKNIGIYFWQREDLFALTAANQVEKTGKYILLGYTQIENMKEKSVTKIKLPLSDDLSITSFTGDLFSMDIDVDISFVISQPINYVVTASDTFISTIKSEKLSDDFRITNKNQLFFGETKFNGLKKLCLYLPDKKEIKKIQFLSKGNSIVSTSLTDSVNVTSYFIKNMNTKNYHLVYTDPNENCITIKRIKG